VISIALGVFWLFVVILWITHKRSIFPLSIYWEAAVGFGGDDYSNYVDYVVHNKDLVLALFECSVRVGAAGGALDGQGCGDVVSFVVQTAFLCKDVLRSASAPRLVGYRSLGLGIP